MKLGNLGFIPTKRYRFINETWEFLSFEAKNIATFSSWQHHLYFMRLTATPSCESERYVRETFQITNPAISFSVHQSQIT
jgi:hypothetical protein